MPVFRLAMRGAFERDHFGLEVHHGTGASGTYKPAT